jgi:hypothetical protein
LRELTLALWLALGAGNPHLSKALEQIRALDDVGAQRTLQAALAWPDNSPTEAGTAHVYLGLIQAVHAKESEAIGEFKKALALDPELRLPPDLSPIVVGWWKRAGGKTEPLPAPVAPVAPIAPLPPQPEPELVKPPELPRSRWKRSAGAALFGAAAVPLLAGLPVGARSRSLTDAAQSEATLGGALSYQRAAGPWAVGANVLFGVAAVMALAGIIFVLLDL